MPHALSHSPATQRPRRFPRSRTALLAALANVLQRAGQTERARELAERARAAAS